MTDLFLVQCDGCEQRVNRKDCTGWLNVQQVVTTQEQLAALVARAQEVGMSDAKSGDFCSARCLASWAANLALLEERGDM